MINKVYLNKLVRLVEQGVITIEDIKDETYKSKVIEILGA